MTLIHPRAFQGQKLITTGLTHRGDIVTCKAVRRNGPTLDEWMLPVYAFDFREVRVITFPPNRIIQREWTNHRPIQRQERDHRVQPRRPSDRGPPRTRDRHDDDRYAQVPFLKKKKFKYPPLFFF